jgi:hypothetical protein
MNIRKLLAAAALLAAASGSALEAQPAEPTLLLSSRSPSNPVVLADGDLLVGARGLLPNTGGIFFVDALGDLATVIGGLPYAGSAAYRNGDVNGDHRVDVFDVFYLIGFLYTSGPEPLPAALEPDGLAARGKTLFVGTGEIVPAGQKASPTRSAVLSITLSAGLGLQEPFFLRAQDYATLLAGQTVVLTNFSEETASVRLLANGVPSVSHLTVDETTSRLYLTSRADSTLSFVPLP